jgi:hypothetical protein
MKSILSLFKPTQTEVAIQEDISRGREKPKPSTVLPGRQSITPSSLGGSELDQLRASLQDMDARLQSAIGERDQLKAEFNDYRQATQADQRDLEHSNRDLRSQLRETGQQLSLHIAAQAQLGPLPDMTEDSTPEGRTDRHYMRLARQLKGDTTGANPQRIERP